MPSTFDYSDPHALIRALDIADERASLATFLKASWPLFDPSSYIHGWHLDCIADHLTAAGNGEFAGYHLLINVPPGTSKSSTTNVAWPAFEWARGHPGHTFMFTANTERLAIRDGVKCRNLVDSEWYRSRYGIYLREKNVTRFTNQHGGYRMAVPVSGVMGDGGLYVVFDDPHNVNQAESDNVREDTITRITYALPTRLRNPSYGCAITIMQRLHTRDYSGHLIETAGNDGRLIHVCLPMRFERQHPHPMRSPLPKWRKDPRTEEGEILIPSRHTSESLEIVEREMSSREGDYAVNGQMQQRPTGKAGGMFKRKHFQFLDNVPRDAKIIGSVRGWDLAATEKIDSDWTVGIRAEIDQYANVYVTDICRERLSPHGVDETILACARIDGRDTVIDIPRDPGQSGLAQKRNFVRILVGYTWFCTPETGSKDDRAKPLAAHNESGALYIIRAPLAQGLMNECTDFPRGKWRDQVDALSRCFSRLVLIYNAWEALQPKGPPVSKLILPTG